jgi:PhnB protein
LISEDSDVKGLNAWFETWEGPLGLEMRELRIAAGGDVAFCSSLNHMSGTKTDGAKPDLWFRQTLCFRKVGGAWKIAHTHESVPFYMDGSFRAAVDLAP